MPKRTESYNAWQQDRLANPGAASAFLNAALEDSLEMFLVALRKVAQAQQMAKVAKEANIQRETLYQALSEEGNPTVKTLKSILGAVGLHLYVGEGLSAEIPARQVPKRIVDVPEPSEQNAIGQSSSIHDQEATQDGDFVFNSMIASQASQYESELVGAF